MTTKSSKAPTLVLKKVGAEPQHILLRKSKLLVVSGRLQGKEFMIDRDVFTIGSGANNDLVIQDSTVSRRHCEIEMSPDGYRIRDLGSTNGTLVQGVRVTEAFLGQGTEFQLAETRVIFCPLQEMMEYALSDKGSFGSLLGRSVAMRHVFHQAETFAPTDSTVLIEGETGTGKEILAEEIHRHSKRRDRPFIVIDCASLAKDIIESELFGHKKGAFTGAMTERVGAFEHADGGTVFLDEIGDLSPGLQPKLLRVLEKREIKRLGTNEPRSINVRIICATNHRLRAEVNSGRFREDLYFRLSVAHIDIPPLRKRKEDIPLLVEKFLRDFCGEDALSQIESFEKTVQAFRNHEWPGNVRELRNLVEIGCHTGRRPINLAAFLYPGRIRTEEQNRSRGFQADRPFKEAKNELIAEFEQQYLRDLLALHEGNVSKAAREAGIERAYLQRLIRKHGLRSKR